jgi:hypothetical protein
MKFQDLFVLNFKDKANLVLSYANNIFKIIQLPIIFDPALAIEIESKKCFARSVIRYHPTVSFLQKVILDYIYKKEEKKFFFSRFYPMIHLSLDISEEGSYHYDQVSYDKADTIWTAITNYNYSALSIFNLDFFEKKIINDLIIKLKIPNVCSSKIKANQGDTFSWKSNLIHKGNLNISSQISIALQMQKFHYQPSSDVLKLYNYEKDYPAMVDFPIENSSLFSLFKKYIFLTENIKEILLKNLSLKNSLLDLKNFLFNEFQQENKIISFALSVLSQRLKTLENKKVIFLSSLGNNINNFCLFLDLSSIFLGCENNLSQKRVFYGKIFDKELLYIFEKFDRKKNNI